MAFFDATLTFAPVAEQNNDPVLPEERLIFELIGLEHSDPDQFRKNGGVRWSWRVFNADGTPFVFQDEQYIFFRTTGVNANGTPLVNIGTNAHDWASAMLGRQLGIDDVLEPSMLRGKRMSAMVVWRKQKTDATKKTVDLASLRTVGALPTPARSASQVSDDPTSDDVDRALLASKVAKKIAQAVKRNSKEHLAFAAIDLSAITLHEMRALLDAVQEDLDALDG